MTLRRFHTLTYEAGREDRGPFVFCVSFFLFGFHSSENIFLFEETPPEHRDQLHNVEKENSVHVPEPWQAARNTDWFLT